MRILGIRAILRADRNLSLSLAELIESEQAEHKTEIL